MMNVDFDNTTIPKDVIHLRTFKTPIINLF